MEIKNEKIQFTVSVEISCTDSESFENQSEFQNTDLSEMRNYISKKIQNVLVESFKFSAKVDNVIVESVE